MLFVLKLPVIASLLFLAPVTAAAEETMIEDFESQPEARWQFFADTVMGGVSSGRVEFVHEGGEVYTHMTGRVSTENNGGFIQIRTKLQSPLPSDTVGLRLIVKGNDQRYFAHLRTSGTILPWQYYQAGFNVTQEWTEVKLPLADFKASGRLLHKFPKAKSVKSVAIVAFGRDHDADIYVREVSFYRD